ncbi:MAG: hypothetical protein ACR2IF_18885 [Terriglobales bacterium]
MKSPGFLGIALLFLIAGSFVGTAHADRGIVVKRKSGCDYFVVYSSSGYAVLEWFGGYDPDEEDILVGTINSYGMRDVHDETADDDVTVWVEDYRVSRSKAMEILYEKCEE